MPFQIGDRVRLICPGASIDAMISKVHPDGGRPSYTLDFGDGDLLQVPESELTATGESDDGQNPERSG